MKRTRNRPKVGDWILVRAGVIGEKARLLEIIKQYDDNYNYKVVDVNDYYAYDMYGIVFDTGYAVQVPKSRNIEMLEILYMPVKGLLDEETQN